MARVASGWVVVAALLLAACGSDPESTEVLGISVEREPEPSAAASPSEADPEPEPVEAASPSASPTESAPTPSVKPSTSAPSPKPAATTPAPPPASPSPEPPPPSPEPEALTLGAAQSNGFSRWQPQTEPAEDCCWTELEGSPPQDRDTPWSARAVRGSLSDPVPAEPGAPEPWQRRVREAACTGAFVAPADRPMRVRGTATTEIRYGDVVVVSHPEAVDVTVPAGGRHTLARTPSHTVDAADGRPVSCTVRFAPA